MGANLLTPGIAALIPLVELLYEEAFHENFIFPEDSNETVTFTAGGTVNTFGAWAEIVDNNSVSLSSKMVAGGHISSIISESANTKDKVYMLEISYGAAKTVIARARMISATNQISHTEQDKMRNLAFPAGETIYYRVKCETASATVTVHFRYHIHG